MEDYNKDSERDKFIGRLLLETGGCSDEELLDEFETARQLKIPFPDKELPSEEFEKIWTRIQGERIGENSDENPDEDIGQSLNAKTRDAGSIRGRFDWKRLAAVGLIAGLLVGCGCIAAMGIKLYFFREGKNRLSQDEGAMYTEYTLDTADSSKQNDPSSFSVLGRDFIDGKCKGNPIKIMRILDDGTIYELVVTDAAEPGELAASQEKKVFVSDRKGESVECTAVLDGTDRIGDQPLNRIYVLDANFDGKKDILLDQGHSGSQESATYQCFISDGNTFVSCPSFSDIENPVIDHPDKMVLSSWRNWAASHSWAKYHFDGGRFVMTDCLTEEETGSDSHDAVWRYTIEKRLHNKMQEVERFSTKNRSDKELDAMIFDKDSGWGLLSDKWKSNDLDLGMAGDGSLDSRLWDIIHQ